MMKKTYTTPCMEIVKIQTAGMLAGSMNLNDTTVSGNSALSRESDIYWDDEY